QPKRRSNMRVEWYGQSAFRLSANGSTVVIDPFGDVSGFSSRGIEFGYPAIAGVMADLVLVTHEHPDHNGTEVVGGDPFVLRSTAGRLESPVGEIVAVASEHDPSAGTERGPNTIFSFELSGVRVCHFGDFGQSSLRPEQAAPRSTHGARSSFDVNPSGATLIHPAIERPPISMSETCSRAIASSLSSGSMRTSSPP